MTDDERPLEERVQDLEDALVQLASPAERTLEDGFAEFRARARDAERRFLARKKARETGR